MSFVQWFIFYMSPILFALNLFFFIITPSWIGVLGMMCAAFAIITSYRYLKYIGQI